MIKRTCLPCQDAAFVEQALVGDGAGVYASGLMRPAQQRIEAYFQGEPEALGDLPLWRVGQSRFCQDVYAALGDVRPGTTVHYGELARMAGHPGAARAVGRAMSVNPTPLIVPCHRVVSASGATGGFSAQGGIDAKKRLLQHEKEVFACVRASRDAGDRQEDVL